MEVLQQTHKEILQNLIQRANEGHYTCNRGPRPSGAMLRKEGGKYFSIMGDVKPSVGSPSCKDDGCMIVDGHCVRNIHAEVDALLRAAKLGEDTDGAIMYSINKPCYNCTVACIKAGISKIYYAYVVYDEQRTQAALTAASVLCEQVYING